MAQLGWVVYGLLLIISCCINWAPKKPGNGGGKINVGSVKIKYLPHLHNIFRKILLPESQIIPGAGGELFPGILIGASVNY